MIETLDGRLPEDYKFYVYNGTVRYIQVDLGRFTNHTRAVFDREWKRLPVRFEYPEGSQVPKPQNLLKMLEIAEEIGSPFDFVRVDLYSTPNRVIFGEVAFYPEAGMGSFFPKEWDRQFGEPWRIPVTQNCVG